MRAAESAQRGDRTLGLLLAFGGVSHRHDGLHDPQRNLPVLGRLVLPLRTGSRQSGQVLLPAELGLCDNGGHDTALRRGRNSQLKRLPHFLLLRPLPRCCSGV